ncbi:hypothetical protein [Brevibacillus sp. 179-C9.3 HS]|uniref:hypothetical protein n=1 Tax=unclassified Brevibacillus TaxID=2684853 RepID=UPI0039A30DC4
MADNFYASILIPTRYITEEVREVIKAEISEWNLNNASEEDGVTYFEDHFARNGYFKELEEMLVQTGIPFDRSSSGFGEYMSEIRYYRPGEIDQSITVTNDGGSYIETYELKKLLQMTADEAYLKLAELIALADPQVTPLEEIASEDQLQTGTIK